MPDKKVAQLNIDRFRKLLATETDETKRKLILRLLAEEEAKLASTGQTSHRRIAVRTSAIRASGWAARQSVAWFLRRSIRQTCGGMGTQAHADPRGL
jgi:hypothetical protein